MPGIPQAILNAKPSSSIQSLAEATEILADFIKSGNIAVLTGAGVSVDSGIRAYRGDDGRYMNPNYKYIKSHYCLQVLQAELHLKDPYFIMSL